MKTSNPTPTLILVLAALVAGGLGACARDEPGGKDAAKAARAPSVPAQAAPLHAASGNGKGESAAPEEGGEPGALTVFADVDESVGEVPHTVKLDVEVIDGTGVPPFKFIWDFGDATEFSTEKSPTHTYKIPGSFRASVIVTDARGEVDQDFYDISVNEPLEPGAITAEQLMQMEPPGEIAPELEGLEGSVRKKLSPSPEEK